MKKKNNKQSMLEDLACHLNDSFYSEITLLLPEEVADFIFGDCRDGGGDTYYDGIYNICYQLIITEMLMDRELLSPETLLDVGDMFQFIQDHPEAIEALSEQLQAIKSLCSLADKMEKELKSNH